ncbi:MAG: segregation/condensation protein A [bacterium]
MYAVSNDQFEGPLDLLLQLIEKEKLEITTVSLSKITSAYLEQIENMQGTSSEMADFLVVAAKLLYLKSKELLPDIKSDEEEEEIEDLEAKLREYSIYKKAAANLESILIDGQRGYSRRAKSESEIIFLPPQDINHQMLFAIFQETLNKLPEQIEERVITDSPEQKITIEDKKKIIYSLTKKKKTIRFKEILAGAKNKTEVIVTFLAILEMIKQKEIGVIQKESFADILIMGLK